MNDRHIEGWPHVAEAEQDEIDRTVAAARESLAAAGFATRDARFPFVMHHERLRVRLRSRAFKPRHAHVAFLLARWARQRDEGFARAYAWQAVSVAVDVLRGPGGGAGALPDAVRPEIEAVRSGQDFESWAKANIGLLRNAS